MKYQTLISAYKAFGKTRPVLFLLSLKLQVVCLCLLFVLVGWGTLYEASAGLYASQQKFFYSWFFLVGEFFPFPGAILILWVLFLNMILVMAYRLQWKWSKFGIWLIHFGLLLLVAGAGFTHYFSSEAFMALKEGEGANGASDYRLWELSMWQEDPKQEVSNHMVSSYLFDGLGVSQFLSFRVSNDQGIFPVTFKIEKMAANADPVRTLNPSLNRISPSGWVELSPVGRDKDPANELPILLLTANVPQSENRQLLLWGGDTAPAYLQVGGNRLAVSLRKKRTELPIGIVLKSFVAEEHQGTQIAKRYESHVLVDEGSHTREAVIKMNTPLRIKDWTFFQASFQREAGSVTSILAVTKNSGAALPYISSGLVFLGLLIHFGIMLLKRLGREEKSEDEAKS